MKIKSAIIAVLLVCSMALPLSALFAEGWYCCHNTDHIQPQCDARFNNISEYGGYYCDKKHSQWNDNEKVIYLTFDAGYENGNVEKILDVLKEKNVKGTFFILENLTKRNPELVKRMANEGNLVCNHTACHKDMSTITDKNVFLAELSRLEKDCKDIGVTCQKFYRPPEGRFSTDNLKWANEAGYKTIFWSFAYADWDNNSQPNKEAAIKKIMDCTHNGEIILLHPTSSTNAAILGELIDKWKEDGFRFALPDEL